MPGVLGVFTAADLGLEPTPSPFNPTVARTVLASDRVRYVGEPIAAVVAETHRQAVDAAEAVMVDYDVLEAVVDPEEALTVVDRTSTPTPAATRCSTRPPSAHPT